MHIGLTGWQREAAEGDHRELLALFQRADEVTRRSSGRRTPAFWRSSGWREVGTGHLRCVFNALGALDRATTLAQMELFAEEVLPACRAIGPL